MRAGPLSSRQAFTKSADWYKREADLRLQPGDGVRRMNEPASPVFTIERLNDTGRLAFCSSPDDERIHTLRTDQIIRIRRGARP